MKTINAIAKGTCNGNIQFRINPNRLGEFEGVETFDEGILYDVIVDDLQILHCPQSYDGIPEECVLIEAFIDYPLEGYNDCPTAIVNRDAFLANPAGMIEKVFLSEEPLRRRI